MAKFGIVVLHAEPSYEAVWEAVQLLMLRHEHLALADHMIQSRAVLARLKTAQVRCWWCRDMTQPQEEGAESQGCRLLCMLWSCSSCAASVCEAALKLASLDRSSVTMGTGR